MIQLWAAIASGFTMLVPASSRPVEDLKAEVSAAAKDCGTTVRFVDLPSEVRKHLPQLGSFTVELGRNTTSSQSKCFFARVPMSRIGFISEPAKPGNK